MSKKIIVYFLFISVLCLHGCSYEMRNVKSKINLDDLYYHFFQEFYNDMYAMQRVIEKINSNQISEAEAMIEIYVSKRDHLYQAVKSHSYDTLSKIYGEEVTYNIQEVVDKTHTITGKLYQYVKDSAYMNNVSMQKLEELFAEYYDLVFKYDDPNPYRNTISSSDLTFFNIVTHPAGVFEENGMDRVDLFIRQVLDRVKELEEILETNS